MFSNRNTFMSVLVVLAIMVFVVNGRALSTQRMLFEKVDESSLVIVGVVVESRTLFETSDDGRQMSQLGRLHIIKIEKVLKGNINSKEIVIPETSPLTMEAALCTEGDRALMFLATATVNHALLSRTRAIKGDEVVLLKQPSCYAFVSGKQGYMYLGVDSELIGKFKTTKKDLYPVLLNRNLRKSSEGVRNQKYLQSTEGFVRITNIKDKEERRRAWKKVLDGGDDVLKESARAKLKNIDKK